VESAESAAQGAYQRPLGTLSVTAPVLFGRMYVTPVLVEYLRRHADVAARCVFVDRIVNIVEDEIDVAVRIGELPDSSLKAVRVGSVRRVLVGAPAYFAAHGEPRHPRELPQHVLIGSSAPSSGGLEWRFEERGRPLTMRIQPRLMTSANDVALTAASAGLGLTRVLSYQAAPYLDRGELRAVLPGFDPPPVPIHVVHAPGRWPAPKVRAFVELAVEMLRGHPALAG
jgi:DNA-binding transcriptional LysR family regulator